MRGLEFREIKFRAFDTKNKTWTYVTLGDLVCGACTNHGDKPLSGAIQIWCEYTGLKDKNGKEIYEGDIIRAWGRNYEIKICEMQDSDCSYFYQGWGFDNSSLYEEHDFVEIIGNIHENPELLEQENAGN